jgi:hypothetical protein
MNEGNDSMRSTIRRLVRKIATEIDPDVEVSVIKIGEEQEKQGGVRG